MLSTIPSIIFSFVLILKLRRTRLFAIFVKSFSIGILYKFFELPSDIGFHLRIFIVWRLISVTDLGLQCHALSFTRFPILVNPNSLVYRLPTSFIKGILSISFYSLIAVILAWNFSGRDLSTFLTILGSGMVSPKLKVEFTMSFSLA